MYRIVNEHVDSMDDLHYKYPNKEALIYAMEDGEDF